jgi:acyl-CoA synthetase (AMP-forming)/AMP-acid ligase II
VLEAASLAGGVKHVVALDGDEDELIPAGMTRFSSLRAVRTAQQPALPPTPCQGHDLALLPYSSGTTGLPKGTMLTHDNIIANLMQCEDVEARFFTQDTVVISPLPMFHIYGFLCSLHLPLLHGNTCITMKRFDMDTFCRLVQEHKVSRAQLVPPIVLGLAKSPIVDKYDMSSLKVLLSGAAPLGAFVPHAFSLARRAAGAAQVKECCDRLGCVAKQAWGMSELSPIGTMVADDDADAPPGTVGQVCLWWPPLDGTHASPPRTQPVGSTSVKVVHPETLQVLPQGQEGELLIKGPQVMKGYLNNPQATAATVDAEGWLRTGDVASLDDDGFVFIHDRLKELIKFKGFQIAPAELEALLTTHPSVGDAIASCHPRRPCRRIGIADLPRPGDSATPSRGWRGAQGLRGAACWGRQDHLGATRRVDRRQGRAPQKAPGRRVLPRLFAQDGQRCAPAPRRAHPN